MRKDILAGLSRPEYNEVVWKKRMEGGLGNEIAFYNGY